MGALESRIPEPELMDSEAQALAYAKADFADVNAAFVERLQARFPELRSGRVLDLGCGPADICLRLAQALPEVEILGVDGAEAMLAPGRAALEGSGLEGRVRLERHLLPTTALPGPFDAVISNSLLHHLHDPAALWSTVRAASRPGTAVLVVDLFRPSSTEAAAALVEEAAADEDPILKEDFYNSLLAAFTPDEVRAQLEAAGLAQLEVSTISERHLAIVGAI